MAIGVALIGCGMAGRYLHAPFLRPAGFDVGSIVTSRRGEVLAKFPSTEVIADPADALARGAETGRRLTPAASRAIRYISGASDV
jgi:predicted dehydrogenase